MKKFLIVFMSLCLTLTMASCSITQPFGNNNSGTGTTTQTPGAKINQDEAKTKADAFVNNVLVQNQVKATISSITEDPSTNLYRFVAAIDGKNYDMYMTTDGKTIFPQAMDVEKETLKLADQKTAADQAKQKSLETLKKTDKPTVELFVMSFCPYGTQVEKGIIPVVEKLGNKIDFQLKFVDYAMHDKKEIDEEIKQYCVMQNYSDKFLTYLKCFLKDGVGKDCATGMSLDKCIKDTDSKYQITASFNDKSKWTSEYPPFAIFKDDNTKYGVQGSPTLIINGKQMDTGRDPASLMKSICVAFTKEPEECKATMDTATPTPGFGFSDKTSATSNASCGS